MDELETAIQSKLKQNNLKQKIIKAIGEAGRKVTVADIATKTGLPILSVSPLLNQVAAETGGHLIVNQSGEILYSFSPGFSNAYLTKGIAKVFEDTFAQIAKIAYFLFKISFGILLILSLIIIIVILLTLKSQSNRDNDRDDRDIDFHFNFFDYMIMRDIMSYFIYTSQPSVVYDYNSPTIRKRKNSNFLLDCFSFLFGDGDPNEGLEEKRWQLIAKVIKNHNYVITSEQLAPYTGAKPGDEDAVLPVLVRFDGKPEVSESGNIIYTFPNLASTANKASQSSVPFYLKEFPWKFTNVPASSLTPVYLIAGANFVGSIFVYSLTHADPELQSTMLGNLTTILVAYGSMFLIVPLVRYLIQKNKNEKISKRNTQREEYATLLQTPSAELKKKLTESREYRMRATVIDTNNAAYATDKDTLDQKDDLDKKFEILEKSKPFDASP